MKNEFINNEQIDALTKQVKDLSDLVQKQQATITALNNQFNQLNSKLTSLQTSVTTDINNLKSGKLDKTKNIIINDDNTFKIKRIDLPNDAVYVDGYSYPLIYNSSTWWNSPYNNATIVSGTTFYAGAFSNSKTLTITYEDNSTDTVKGFNN